MNLFRLTLTFTTLLFSSIVNAANYGKVVEYAGTVGTYNFPHYVTTIFVPQGGISTYHACQTTIESYGDIWWSPGTTGNGSAHCSSSFPWASRLVQTGPGDFDKTYYTVEAYYANEPAGDCGLVSNPVNVLTGTKYQAETLFKVPANQGLSVHYTYNSLFANKLGAFGYGWFGLVDENIEFDINENEERLAYVTLENGKNQAFLERDGKWSQVGSNVSTYSSSFSSDSAGFYFSNSSGHTRAYDLSGNLLSKESDNGKFVNYVYVDGVVQEISDAYGRQTLITYNSLGLVDVIQDPDGNEYTFQYDADSRLIRVTFPDQPISEKLYHYEDNNHPNHLSGITDENGVRFATWTYDETGFPTSSQHAGAVDNFSFAFTGSRVGKPSTVTITSPLGQITRYRNLTSLLSGSAYREALLLTDQNDIIAQKEVTLSWVPYVGNVISSEPDWNGNLTNYSYDSEGFLYQVIKGAGSNSQRYTNITWDKAARKPTRISEGSEGTIFTYDQNGRLISKETY